MAEPMSLDEDAPIPETVMESVEDEELRNRPDTSVAGSSGSPLSYPVDRDGRLAEASLPELARHSGAGLGSIGMVSGQSTLSLDATHPFRDADEHAPATVTTSGVFQPGRLGIVTGTEEICTVCGSTNGPWRRGPLGLRTLCNSCGHIAGSSRDAQNHDEAIELLDALRLARIGRVKRRHDPAGTADILLRLLRLSDRTLALVQWKFATPSAALQLVASSHRAQEQSSAFPTAPYPYTSSSAVSTPPRRGQYPLTAGLSTGMTPALGTLDLSAEPLLRRGSESSFPTVSLSASSSPGSGQEMPFGPRQSSVHPATSAWSHRLPVQQRFLQGNDLGNVSGVSSTDRQHLDPFAVQRGRIASRTSGEWNLPPLPALPPLGGPTRLNPQRTSPSSYALDSYRQTSPPTGRRSPPARLGVNPSRTGPLMTEGIPLRMRSQSIAHMRVPPYVEPTGSTSTALQGLPPLSSASDDYFARRSPRPPSGFYP